MRYSVFESWSPTLGCDAQRISVADEQGLEYFVLGPKLDGRADRDFRNKALDVLRQAIEAGTGPGEYRWRA